MLNKSLLGIALLFTTTLACAHYPFLIADRSPDWVPGYTFDEGTFELTDKLQKNGNIFNIKYRSRRIGDTWIVAHVPMTWSKHDSTFTETTMRTVIHQGLSRDWEMPLGLPLKIVPLNQPYGLLPGDSFRMELLHNGEPLPDAKIYAEKYYDPPLQKPYPSESLLTRTSRTDGNGIANIELHSSDWWVLFVIQELNEMEKMATQVSPPCKMLCEFM